MTERINVTLVIEMEVDKATADALPPFDMGPDEPPIDGITSESMVQLGNLSHQLWEAWHDRLNARITNLWCTTSHLNDTDATF